MGHQPILELDDGIHLVHDVGVPVDFLNTLCRFDQRISHAADAFLIRICIFYGFSQLGKSHGCDRLFAHLTGGPFFLPSFLINPAADRLPADSGEIYNLHDGGSLHVKVFGHRFPFTHIFCHTFLLLDYEGKVAKPGTGTEKTVEGLQGITESLHTCSQSLHTFLCAYVCSRKFAAK